MNQVVLSPIPVDELISKIAERVQALNKIDDGLTQPWYSVPEAALVCRVRPATIRLWLSSGRLPGTVNAGQRKTLIPRSALASILKTGKASDED